ncbi:hypothetical protein NM688_g858 [Phlebia brevispora]|uniref:Uncharacterized protein n=1 Tax=Phlebia brevispora TaxID=194682 RepID=A0ACC1TDW5_9APHY|nr:hypothetical protein NM688_g858 [Phlebia brevispora]
MPARMIRQISTASSRASEEPEELKEKHCVRCHSTYYDPEEKCRIPHVFEEIPQYLSQGKFTCISECCGETATVTQRKPGSKRYWMDNSQFCVESTHTTSSAAVKYNGINIRRCTVNSQGRCTREVLVVKDNTPIWREPIQQPRVEWTGMKGTLAGMHLVSAE